MTDIQLKPLVWIGDSRRKMQESDKAALKSSEGVNRKMKKEVEPVIVEERSGNVFADLGFEKPEEELLKAKLALQLFRILKEKKLTQIKAAEVLGVDQPELCKLKNGKYSRFSVGRLFGFITLLDHDIKIEIKPTPKKAKSSHIEVRAV